MEITRTPVNIILPNKTVLTITLTQPEAMPRFMKKSCKQVITAFGDLQIIILSKISSNPSKFYCYISKRIRPKCRSTLNFKKSDNKILTVGLSLGKLFCAYKFVNVYEIFR